MARKSRKHPIPVQAEPNECCVRVALYVRLSVEDNGNHGDSIETLQMLLHDFVAGHPEMQVQSVYTDNGLSGTHFERPAMQELLTLIQNGKIDCVIVKDFSRFGRDSIDTGYFIEQVFPVYHTRFISISDGYDSAQHPGDTGGMDSAFRYLINEAYSRDLSIKNRSAKYAKMRRGEFQSAICPYGYRKSADGRMEPNEETAS